MQHLSNYFVQILVIRSKSQGAQMVQEDEKIPGGSCSLILSRSYEVALLNGRQFLWHLKMPSTLNLANWPCLRTIKDVQCERYNYAGWTI